MSDEMLSMTPDQIKHMVDRFLGWPLPRPFRPDGGISFEQFANKGTPHQYERHPVGTNLFDATQADAMVRFMIEGLPPADDGGEPGLGWKLSPAAREKIETLIYENTGPGDMGAPAPGNKP